MPPAVGVGSACLGAARVARAACVVAGGRVRAVAVARARLGHAMPRGAREVGTAVIRVHARRDARPALATGRADARASGAAHHRLGRRGAVEGEALAVGAARVLRGEADAATGDPSPRAAAQKLGYVSNGLTRVKVEPIDKKTVAR